ncbi:mono-/di-acylglycerol lipase class 3 [Tanacetum coccineum]|uniref:Mono-/di-acylglycerol lipase class 3 n=1 Tax=Tanacetum coccineum TaxID=301880 RepID=A0ABQ5AHE2_9ASTR
MATATAAGAVALLYYTLNKKLQMTPTTEDDDESESLVQSSGPSGGVERVSHRLIQVPATWLETISTLSETLRVESSPLTVTCYNYVQSWQNGQVMGDIEKASLSSYTATAFPKLEKLKFSQTEQLEQWNVTKNIKIMPRLYYLKLSHCNKLQSLPQIVLGLPFKKQRIRKCVILKQGYQKETGVDQEMVSHISTNDPVRLEISLLGLSKPRDPLPDPLDPRSLSESTIEELFLLPLLLP